MNAAIARLAAALLAAATVAACSSTAGSSPDDAPPSSSVASVPAQPDRSTESNAGAASTDGPAAVPEVRCLKISSATAAKILGVPGPYGKSDIPHYPCDAFWTSPINFEAGQGPDSLHGKPSDASVSVEFIDFPDSASATTEFAFARTLAAKGAVNSRGKTWRTITEVDASGDAEAFLDVPAKTYKYSYGSVFESSLVGRCGSRLLRVSAAKSTFYSAKVAGEYADPGYQVRRSRLPARVDDALRRAYATLGAPLCDQAQDMASVLIGPYQRPKG